MKNIALILMLLALPLLNGCLTSSGADQKQLVKPCLLTDEEKAKYHTAKPTTFVIPKYNEITHVNGCTAVRFQIDTKGRSKNVSVLKESPKGSGMGAEFVDQIQKTNYEVPSREDLWYVHIESRAMTDKGANSSTYKSDATVQ